MDVLNHNFIRLGPTRAKALQTASRFPRETRRPFAVPKSNAFTLGRQFDRRAASYAGVSMHQNVNVSLSGRQVKFQVMLAFVFESE